MHDNISTALITAFEQHYDTRWDDAQLRNERLAWRAAWNAAGAAPAAVAGPARDWPDTCDGKEQEAFEAWAQRERHNMEQHPLHYLFLDAETNAARQGWRAGLLYAVGQMKTQAAPALEAPAAPAPAVPDGWRLVPIEFLRGFGTLAHNYSLTAIAPDHYWGNERSAFSDAYVRCGQDLGKLREMLSAEAPPLAAAPQAPAAPAEAQRLAQFLKDRQTHLGSCRESAGTYNQQAWDDYERAWSMLLGQAASAAPVVDAPPLDVCTDPYNCARCKTHPAHRGDMHHAGISQPRSLAQVKEGGTA